MKVLVLGGYGLIGYEVLKALVEAGHDVTGLGRSVEAARRRYPKAQWIEADLVRLTEQRAWQPIVRGFEAVVNCAGVLQDSPRDDIRRIQRDSPLALIAACEAECVSRFVQISAVGARPDAPTVFMATKGEADAALEASSLEWTILRPGLVFAPAAYGATAMLRALAAVPLAIPLASAHTSVRTVGAADVAYAAVACVSGAVPAHCSYDLVEPQSRSLGDTVALLRSWLGYPPAPIVPLPDWMAALAFRLGDVLGYLGWRTPMRTTAFREVSGGLGGDSGPWVEAGGKAPMSLEAVLAAMPSTVQERWYARMWMLRPLAIAILALFWIVSGLLGIARLDDAVFVLAGGSGRGAAAAAILAASTLDIVLGLAVLVRRTHVFALIGMTAATLVYLAVATLVAPGMWLDPLGPLVKTVPAAALSLLLLGVAEER